MELVELRSREEVEFAKACINLYGVSVERFSAQGSRFFALVVDNKICAVAWIHKPFIFTPIFNYYKIDTSNSYFLRRIATCCPGDYAVKLLELLSDKLRSEGKETIVVLGYSDHSNALYKNAGFEYIGDTPRTKKPVFIKKLK